MRVCVRACVRGDLRGNGGAGYTCTSIAPRGPLARHRGPVLRAIHPPGAPAAGGPAGAHGVSASSVRAQTRLRQGVLARARTRCFRAGTRGGLGTSPEASGAGLPPSARFSGAGPRQRGVKATSDALRVVGLSSLPSSMTASRAPKTCCRATKWSCAKCSRRWARAPGPSMKPRAKSTSIAPCATLPPHVHAAQHLVLLLFPGPCGPVHLLPVFRCVCCAVRRRLRGLCAPSFVPRFIQHQHQQASGRGRGSQKGRRDA